MDPNNKVYVVEGFLFHNQAMAGKAVKEQEGIRYIRNKTDMNNPELVLQIYNKVIEQRLFEIGRAHV